MYTHKATREGLTVSITIFGEHGEKFSRRIAENALDDNEMLSVSMTTADSAGSRRFTFSIEDRPPPPPRTKKMSATARPRRESSSLVWWFRHRKSLSQAIPAPQPLISKIVITPTTISCQQPMTPLAQPDATISGT